MGYFGHSAFDNDEAMDWLATVSRANAGARIRKALNSYISFVKAGAKPELATPEYIDSIVEDVRESHTRFPPKWWLESGRPLDELLKEEELELRDHFASGRYLDEQYGPAEEALAAAEAVAVLGGIPPEDLSQETRNALQSLGPVSLTRGIVESAVTAVELLLADSRYCKMRGFFLSAFPMVSGGNDAMSHIENLLHRLQTLRSGRNVAV